MTLAAMAIRPFVLVIGLILTAAAQDSDAPGDLGKPKPAQELPAPQEPPKVVPRLLDGADPGQASVHVSLGRQRAYLSIGNEVAIDTPASTGKPRAQTPKGDFVIEEKKSSHSSRFFGEYVDTDGRPVRSAVSTRTDAAPSGTTFRSVPVEYYLRLNDTGLSLHAGPLPGYPAADVAVWLPADIAPLFFQRVKVGTPVRIGD